MSTMDSALAAIANGETLTTAEMRNRTNASPGKSVSGAGADIATTPRRERLVSLG